MRLGDFDNQGFFVHQTIWHDDSSHFQYPFYINFSGREEKVMITHYYNLTVLNPSHNTVITSFNYEE